MKQNMAIIFILSVAFSLTEVVAEPIKLYPGTKSGARVMKQYFKYGFNCGYNGKSCAYGIETDLNKDSTNEVIGFHSETCALKEGRYFCVAHILQKQNKNWVDISPKGYGDLGFSFVLDFGIDILQSKTNGYYDIMVNREDYLKYKNGKYIRK